MIPVSFFIQILNMSLGAAWAALLVICARFFLRRVPKLYSYALWGVVLFRLVCPVSFSSILSLMPRPQAIPQEIIYAPKPQVESGFVFFDQTVSSVLPPATPQASANPVQIWLEIGNLLWQFGAVILLLYCLLSYLLFLRRLRGAVLVEDNIWESDRIPTAFVLGIFRPKIYLPLGVGEEERKYILCHEQTHIRRMDHIVKPLSLLLLTVHWFNPVLWLAYFLMRRDMEMSCDELAMERLGLDVRKEYSACLLSLSARQNGLAIPLAFGENDVKGRIQNVLRYKKPALWVTALAVVLAVALGFCLMSNPDEDDRAVLADPGDGSGLVLDHPDDGRTGPSQPENSSQSADQEVTALETEEEPRDLINYYAPVRRGTTWQSSAALLETASYTGATQVLYNVTKETPVYSPIRGTVDEIQADIQWPYGRWVSVRSSENSDVAILLSHLSSVEDGLKVGDPVDTNTQLGLSGITGNTTYPSVGVTVRVEENSAVFDVIDGTENLYDLWELVLVDFPDCLSFYLDASDAGEEKETALVGYTRPVRMDDVKRAGLTEAELDLLVERGTPVYSPIRGTIDKIDPSSVWPYGKNVVVHSSENPDIKVTVAHLDSVVEGIEVGDEVDDSTQLGLSGNTGNTPYPAVGVVVQQKSNGIFSEIKIFQWAEVLVNSLYAEEVKTP